MRYLILQFCQFVKYTVSRRTYAGFVGRVLAFVDKVFNNTKLILQVLLKKIYTIKEINNMSKLTEQYDKLTIEEAKILYEVNEASMSIDDRIAVLEIIRQKQIKGD